MTDTSKLVRRAKRQAEDGRHWDTVPQMLRDLAAALESLQAQLEAARAEIERLQAEVKYIRCVRP